MSDLQLHPDVKAFKAFVEKHPQILRAVRTGKHDLNYYFKHYQKHGEADGLWDQFNLTQTKNETSSSKGKKNKWTEQLKGLIDKIEFDKIDQHLKQADSAVGELKNLLDHFSEIRGNQTPPSSPPTLPPQPPVGGVNRRFF